MYQIKKELLELLEIYIYDEIKNPNGFLLKSYVDKYILVIN